MFNGLSFHGKKDFIVIHKVVKIVLFRENKKKCYRKLFDVKNHRVFWIDRFVWKRGHQKIHSFLNVSLNEWMDVKLDAKKRI